MEHPSPSTGAPAKRPLGRRRRRLRRTIMTLVLIFLIGGSIGGAIYWKSRPDVYRPGEEMEEISRNLDRDLPEGAPVGVFEDSTINSGLEEFRSFAGPRSSQLPEDMGAGAAWGDFDNDGDDDLFLVSAGGSLTAPPEEWAPCALYENTGLGSFTRVAGFPDLRIIGMAASWGDADGDGWLDLVVTGYNHLSLYRNNDGVLVRDDGFPFQSGFWAGASWGDFDNDRDLDLYVCGYVQYEPTEAGASRTTSQFGTAVPYTLNPSSYEPQENLLFVNDGNGNFEDAAESFGVSNPEGRSLGALWHDFDSDGRLDLYVANDVSDNVFYRNTENGFVDASHPAWVADYRGAMGMTIGDYDRDNDDDMFITHWVGQENALYDCLVTQMRNMPPPEDSQSASHSADIPHWLRFADSASMNGLGQVALQRIGWGTEFADFDADGWLDLIVANGSTFETSDTPKMLKPQPAFLFWNQQGTYFHEIGRQMDGLNVPSVGRGLAVSDYDGDGDLDAIIVRHGQSPQLLRNEMQTGNWLQLRLRSRNASGDLLGFGDGAVVTARIGDVTHRRNVFSTSYLSQSSRMVHLGIGDADQVDELSIRWLGGETDVYQNIKANCVWEIGEGEDEPILLRAASDPLDTERALSDADRVRQFWAAHRAGMNALKVRNDLQEAIGLFRQALTLNPDHEDARYYLGNCLAATGDLPGAQREFEELVRVNPRSRRGLERLGILHVLQAQESDDLRTGIEFLDRALAINSEETGVLIAMGEVELMLGDLEQARERFEWVSHTNPRAVGALYLRGYIAWQVGDDVIARDLLAAAHEARGDEWKPEGTTAEGDAAVQMFSHTTPLAGLIDRWNGTSDPGVAYERLHRHLESLPWRTSG